MKRTGGGQFGAGLKNAGGNHRYDQIPHTAGFPIEDCIQSELAERAYDSSYVAMGQRA